MGLTAIEQETVITFNSAEPQAIIYTCQKHIKNKLDKLCVERPEDYKRIKQDEVSSTYLMNKECLKFGKKRILTDEQRKSIAEKLKGS